MRIVALVLSLIVLLATYASAETLIYANTLPQGKWGVEAVYLQDSNVANTSGMTLTNYGVKVAYGVTNQLELDLAYGTGSYSGLPAGLTSSMTPTTAVLRYNILAESTAPATVTVAAGYKSIPVTTNYAGNSTYGKSGVGVIASKMMIPFIPYAALSYNTLDMSGANIPSTELTIGTAFAWSKQGQVLVEYTNQALVNYPGVGNFTSPQIGVGVVYTL